MQSDSLFRSSGRDGLLCAVPEVRSVPCFLASPRWVFSGKPDGQLSAPLGFDETAAAGGVRFNGFHVFMIFERGG